MRLLSNNIAAFHQICCQGTVHGAARALGLTQTAVTQRLQALEAALGATLFLRSRSGMTLTAAGEALARYAKRAIELEGETLAALVEDTGPQQARVTIEGPSSVVRARLIPALAPVLAGQPNLAIEYRISDIVSGVQSLKRGDCDLAVLKRKDVVAEFDSRLLKPERYVLVGPPAWAGRRLADVVASERIIDFDPTDEMTFAWLEAQSLREQARPDRHFVNNTDALASMIALGLGYSVLATAFAKPLLDRGDVTLLGGGKTLDFEIALAWYPRRHLAPYWQKILAAIK